MRTRIVFIAFALLFQSSPAPARAQASGSADPAPEQEVEGTRSALVAGVFEYLVPTMGYAYAGNWKKGLLPNAVLVAGSIVLFQALVDETMDTISQLDSEPDCGSNCWIGLALVAVGKTWAITGAVQEARRHNEWLRQVTPRAAITPLPDGRWAVRFTLRR